MNPLGEPEFMSGQQLVAVGATHLFTIGVKVDGALTTTFRWDFGDGSSPVTQTLPAPCDTMEAENGGTQMFVEHSVNMTYTSPGNYHLQVGVSNQFEQMDKSIKISVRHVLKRLFVNSSALVAVVHQAYPLEAFTDPATDGVIYTWNFGDESKAVQGAEQKVERAFTSVGDYNVTLCADNTLSILRTWLLVQVVEKMSGLSVSCNGLQPVNNLSLACRFQSVTVNTSASFWAASGTGSNVSVIWDFGDGSPVEPKEKVSHVFTQVGEFTATAFNAISRESVSVKVNVSDPVSDFSLQSEQPFAVVGEETKFTAVSSEDLNATYYWTVDGLLPTQKGSRQLIFIFPKAGQYQVRSTARHLESRREALILVEVFEPMEALRIDSPSLINRTYLPTREDVVFVASMAKGSNVTYEWLVAPNNIKHQVEADGERLHFGVESPAGFTIRVNASNKLGERTSLVSVVALERVSGAQITTPRQILPAGKSCNLSVSVLTGSDLNYIWHVDSNLVQTDAPFILHNFTKSGNFLVQVVVHNAISQSDDNKNVSVQEEVEEADFTIAGKMFPFDMSTNTLVSFQGFVRKGSDLHWEWKMSDAAKLFCQSHHALAYTFPLEGIYSVSLNVSNAITWQEVTHDVVIQDPIEGLALNMSKDWLCTEEEVTFVPTITKGTNATFVLMFETQGRMHSQDVLEGSFSTSKLPAGLHKVQLKAWNQVSSAQMSTQVQILEKIQGIRLLSPSHHAVEALKEIRFEVDEQNEFAVNYTWIFHFEDAQPLWLKGKEVIFTPPTNGSLSLTALANNGVCSEMLNKTLTVEWPVQEVQLICQSEAIFAGHAAFFSATTIELSNLKYVWTFGNSLKKWPTHVTWVNHTFGRAGEYLVTVNVSNHVSHTSAQLRVDVLELECAEPQASLIQSQPTIFRSRANFFEARVDLNCSAYETTYRWEMFRALDCTHESGNGVLLNGTTSPFLHLPKNSLDVGRYCLWFSVSLQGTPLWVRRKTKVTVVCSPLVAVIKGGSHRLWPSTRDLVLDGRGSRDPDAKQGEDALRYQWTFTIKNSTIPIESNSSIVTIASKQLHPDTLYTFTLTVTKAGRTPVSFTQTVSVCEAAQLPVFVECVSCPGHAPLILSGHCGECDERAQHTWSAQDAESGATLDLLQAAISTGRRSTSRLVLRSHALLPGNIYTFTLNVSVAGRWGSASQTLVLNQAPSGGLCQLEPESHIHPLGTVVHFNCSGWRDEGNTSSELIYTFQVAPCHPVMCPLLTLYRGTRATFGSLVPAGSPVRGQNKSLITVTLLIEDNLGSSVVALNRTLSVQSHVNTSEWLGTKSQKDMWALVQHGNPQEIIPYSIALTSQLNQMESGPNTRELPMKKEIRENVTKALVSLPISSMMDVDQISSALAQSTAFPDEFTCAKCQEKVLEAAEKMIRILEDHKRSGGGRVSAFDTGKNILSVVGSSLASSSASASQHDDSTTQQFLSALSQAGALMRSLMRSPDPWEMPLSLVTPYISTTGFYGDPAELLCSVRSKQPSTVPSTPPPCPFQIPTSLSTRLKSQRSELVQVLLALDGSHSLLAAADPPISTTLVAMEISTPQGEPLAIQDLEPEQAIRVTLRSNGRLPAEMRRSDESADGHANGTCPTVTLPLEGRLNFTIQSVAGLDENAGLYISFNFSLLAGVTPPETVGRVQMEITNGFQDSFTKEWLINHSALNTFTEKTVFLSPLFNDTAKTLCVSLSSFVEGAPVAVSLCVFSSLCQYFSLKEMTWSSEGLKSLEGTTLQTVHCLTHHLTMFGASLFLHPGAVVLLPPATGPSLNAVVGIVCVALLLLHLLVGLIGHKMDHLDSLRVSQVPLCGPAGLYQYRVLVKTGWRHGAGTTAHVAISLYGVNKSGSRHLQRPGAFQRGSLDHFHLETDVSLGELWKIRIWHDNTGSDPSWYVQHVVVWDPVTDHMFFFLVDDWLSVENPKNGTVEKEILASCPEELSQFGRILCSQLLFGMVERHLWLSLWQRPIHSLFTRAQRVTCSALMLHLYLASGALWYGAVASQGRSGPVSAKLPVTMETLAVGMVVALVLFPLQCFICFLFGKSHNQVIVDTSLPSSPVCYSVEMDVYLGQSELSGPSFLSLFGASSRLGDSPSSLLESKAFDSSMVDFWAASGLAPQTNEDDTCQEETAAASWASCDSLLTEPEDLDQCEASLALCATGQLRRKKAPMQLHLTPAGQKDQESAKHKPNMKTCLTLSEENLLMSIEEAAATDDTLRLAKNNSDSGRDSPTTNSSFSNTQSTSCSSWSDNSDDKYLHEAERLQLEAHSAPSQCQTQLFRCPSVLSVDSVASTFLPSPSPDLTSCSSTTRIGIARGRPGWLFPPWMFCVIYPLVATLMGACLALVAIYGRFFSRTVVLMWLISTLSAFLTSLLLLEPLKVCLQALIYTVVWRPVDPEVEDQLGLGTTTTRAFGEHGGKVRPPCGYGLLRAKEEARKVRALGSLMRDSVEKSQGRLLHSAVRRQLHTAPLVGPSLTSIRNCLDAERWMNGTLVTYLHRNALLHLAGSPRLLYAHSGGRGEVILGNSSMTTHQVLADLRTGGFCIHRFQTLFVDSTQYHRESGLFLCLSIRLDWTQRFTSFLSIYPLLIPSRHDGLDLHLVLMLFLLACALLILIGELRSMANERAGYVCGGKHWLQLLSVALSLAASVLHLSFRSQATSCVSQLKSQADRFINFHGCAELTQRSSQCAAVLLTLLVLKLLGTLRFVRRWVVIIRVLNRARKELWTLSFLSLLLLLFMTHLGNTLFSQSVEGFLSTREILPSLMSVVRGGRIGLQRLRRVHPVLGPLYGILLMGASVWLLAKLFGAVLIRAYRAEKADIYRPTTEPQDYEMVDFFIKRLKLWIGLTKAKEFRHRVKFDGMDVPSRASQESRLSTLFSSLPSSHSPSTIPSPRPLSVLSEDSTLSEPGFDVRPFLEHLLPCVNALLSQFDRLTQISEDSERLEIELEDIVSRRKKSQISNKEKCEDRLPKSSNQEPDGRTRRRRTGLLYTNPPRSISPMFPFTPSTIQRPPAAPVHLFPRTRSSYSESGWLYPLSHMPRDATEAAATGSSSLHPINSSGFPKRRAWHSGSSHSADAAQRLWLKQGGVAPYGNSAFRAFVRPNSEEGGRRISVGAPKKRKAWISEGPL
ncbi:polycystin-1 isoform X2 [Syngnathus acus]|uniref:polycystin-1 isoform X2 n=1 Tax=Syngnathus acus TaxID=161584 RepID=UPI001885DC68|nr:polycystin-1 isoform X2 [Syngnathus acus]